MSKGANKGSINEETKLVNSDLANNLAVLRNHIQTRKLNEAAGLCQKLLREYPQHPEVLYNAALISLRGNQPQKALAYLKRSIKVNPSHPVLHDMIGQVYHQLGELENAVLHYQQTLQLNPNFGEAHYHLAIVFNERWDFVHAEQHYQQAIAKNFIHPIIHNNLANCQYQQGKSEDALVNYKNALTIDPTYAECYYNMGLLLQKQERYPEALTAYTNATKYAPNYIDAYQGLALIYKKIKQPDQAITNLRKALTITPDPVLYNLLGGIYYQTKNFTHAISIYADALVKYPDDIHLLSNLIESKRSICCWDNLTDLSARLFKVIDNYLANDLPMPYINYLAAGLTAEKQFQTAKNIVKKMFDGSISSVNHGIDLTNLRRKLGFSHTRQRKEKIRIGYMSGNIYNHPSSHLFKTMFSFHDRNKFEIFLYSIGRADDSIYRQEIPKTADHFFDLITYSTEQCAKKIYDDHIDIFVDMMGYSDNCRPAVLALKPAPLQCFFLAFPGTLGNDFTDYFIVDPNSVPLDQARFYTEKLIYMPHTYFVTDGEQKIAPEKITRAEAGLPEHAIVLCCFNRHYKIDPEVYEVWMQILMQLDNAVLWLYCTDTSAQANLRKQAEKRGVSPQRILFAGSLPKPQHLARMQLADLFLDCFIYSAHTTAVDALLIGLPVITRKGYSLATNATCSILAAMEVPELIADNTDDYKNMILDYATNPTKLTNLREKIKCHKTTAPLFNTQKFVRDLEKRFETIWEIYLAGEPPKTILLT